jgi:hypothetical protein
MTAPLPTRCLKSTKEPNTTNPMVYLETCLEAPTRRGDVFSLQASMSFFSMNRHSRNIEKKG